MIDEGFYLIDLEAELKKRKKKNTKNQFHFPVDGHWNKNGHIEVTNIILENLKQNIYN